MILKEATIGGVLYCEWDSEEMAKPESERVAFEYGPITNREKIELRHKAYDTGCIPNGADVCLAAIDGRGKKIRNLKKADGTPLDTVAKCLEYNDAENTISYLLTIIGHNIWKAQAGREVELKNLQ